MDVETEKQMQEMFEQQLTRTRNDGLQAGAKYIGAAMLGIITKHTVKEKVSVRDYRRMVKDLLTVLDPLFKDNKDNKENG